MRKIVSKSHYDFVAYVVYLIFITSVCKYIFCFVCLLLFNILASWNNGVPRASMTRKILVA